MGVFLNNYWNLSYPSGSVKWESKGPVFEPQQQLQATFDHWVTLLQHKIFRT